MEAPFPKPRLPITLLVAWLVTVRTAVFTTVPRRERPPPPVRAGFRPIRVMMASDLWATFTMAKISTIQGSTSSPEGTVDTTENSILKHTRLVTVSRHMEPNIRHQPVKIPAVFLLPPMAKARGAVRVSMARMTYRSASSMTSPSTLNMTMTLQIMAMSQEAVRVPKMLSSTRVTLVASGMLSSSMTLEVRSSPMRQIWGLASSRKANTKVRANSSLGSSPSKPNPAAMLFSAWNTRLPSSRAQPAASRTWAMSSMMGIWDWM